MKNAVIGFYPNKELISASELYDSSIDIIHQVLKLHNIDPNNAVTIDNDGYRIYSNRRYPVTLKIDPFAKNKDRLELCFYNDKDPIAREIIKKLNLDTDILNFLIGFYLHDLEITNQKEFFKKMIHIFNNSVIPSFLALDAWNYDVSGSDITLGLAFRAREINNDGCMEFVRKLPTKIGGIILNLFYDYNMGKMLSDDDSTIVKIRYYVEDDSSYNYEDDLKMLHSDVISLLNTIDVSNN